MTWFPEAIWPCVEAFWKDMLKACSVWSTRDSTDYPVMKTPWVQKSVAETETERPMLLQMCLFCGAAASATHIESKAPSKSQWTHNSGKCPLGQWLRKHVLQVPLVLLMHAHTGISTPKGQSCVWVTWTAFMVSSSLSCVPLLHRSFSSRIQEGKVWHILGTSVTHGEISVITNPRTTPSWKSKKANLFPLVILFLLKEGSFRNSTLTQKFQHIHRFGLEFYQKINIII